MSASREASFPPHCYKNKCCYTCSAVRKRSRTFPTGRCIFKSTATPQHDPAWTDGSKNKGNRVPGNLREKTGAGRHVCTLSCGNRVGRWERRARIWKGSWHHQRPFLAVVNSSMCTDRGSFPVESDWNCTVVGENLTNTDRVKRLGLNLIGLSVKMTSSGFTGTTC